MWSNCCHVCPTCETASPTLPPRTSYWPCWPVSSPVLPPSPHTSSRLCAVYLPVLTASRRSLGPSFPPNSMNNCTTHLTLHLPPSTPLHCSPMTWTFHPQYTLCPPHPTSPSPIASPYLPSSLLLAAVLDLATCVRNYSIACVEWGSLPVDKECWLTCC